MICYFSSHSKAENRNLIRSVISSYFSDVIDILSKDDLPDVKPGSVLISDRTTFFFKQDYLSKFDAAYNVHPSLLPNHKGSFPVLWACLNGDAHGVSIHVMNADVDAGDIVWQQEVPYSDDESFSHVFYRSRQYIIHGLHQTCRNIVSGVAHDNALIQVPDSFHHKKKDGEAILSLFPSRWHTLIGEARQIWQENS